MTNIREFEFINRLARSCRCDKTVKVGIGDDTAVLPFSAKEDILLTTDMSVEGTHFLKNTPPDLIGRKTLARNLSDIAAMGGVPTYAVVSIGLPKNSKTAYVQKIYQGINRLAARFRVSIVGGDTVKSDKLVINIALLGKVGKGKAILRSGARPGDFIFVTGPLGNSFKSGHHLIFTPRLVEAHLLVKKFHPTSMIDISDGLAGDLGHILEKSKVGAILEKDKIPLNRGASLKSALSEGEDFELLFTLPPQRAKRSPFFCIGTITNVKNKMSLRDKYGTQSLIKMKGFMHF